MPESQADPSIVPAHEERKASPLSGCLIFIILIAVFTSLGGFIIWHYADTKKAVNAISEEVRREVAVAPYVPEQLDALKLKLKIFSDEVKEKKVTSIRISVDEFNLGIAKFEKMEEFKSKMFITKITSESIHADICFPLKGGFTSDRYLNGTMQMQPKIEQGSIFPIITEIVPNTGSPVPPKMIRFIPQALFSSYRTDPDLTAVFHNLSGVELEDGYMTVSSGGPDAPTFPKPSLSEGSDNLYTALAICGILFFVFFSTGCTIYWIRKKSKLNKARKLAEEQESYRMLEAEAEEHKKAEIEQE